MKTKLINLLAVTVWSVTTLMAQTAPVFTVQASPGSGGATQTISDSGTLSLAASGIGVPLKAAVTVALANPVASGNVVLTTFAQAGSADFTVTGFSKGAALNVNNPTTAMSIAYTPHTGQQQNAAVTFSYTYPTGTGTLTVNLSGTSPEFAVTRTFPGDVATPLAANASLALPLTGIGQASFTAITFANIGTSAGVIQGASISGAPQIGLSGVATGAATVQPGTTYGFSVVFQPTTNVPVTASVQVSVPGGPFSFTLTGTGSGAVFAYEIVQASGATTLLPNGLISVPNTALRSGTLTVIRMRNTGNSNGVLSVALVTGSAFKLSDAPPLPATIPPGGSVLFTVSFTPANAGVSTGTLQLGNDVFNLAGTGIGTALAYSYTSQTVTVPVIAGGAIVLPSAAVGQSSSVVFSILNSSAAPLAIGTLGVFSPDGVFSVPKLPATPVTLAANQQLDITLQFAPRVAGAASATLQVDAQTFSLTAFAQPPPALPAYSFQGPSGSMGPAAQLGVGLSLASPYSLDLTGTLTLSFASDAFVDDPSIQFATGGRTIAFTIPAGSTAAVFSNKAKQILFQTGTVAGLVSLAPTFATASGADVTPAAPLTLSLTVAKGAPVIASAALDAKTDTTLSLLIDGYATGRTLTQMTFQFVPKAGATLAANTLTVDVTSAFAAWYGSTASAPFGSQFSATVPFAFAAGANQASPTSAVQSVVVTLTNAQGASTQQTINLP